MSNDKKVIFLVRFLSRFLAVSSFQKFLFGSFGEILFEFNNRLSYLSPEPEQRDAVGFSALKRRLSLCCLFERLKRGS